MLLMCCQVSLTYYGMDRRGLASVLVSWATCDAVIDAQPDLGDCTAPGVPAGVVFKPLNTDGLMSAVLYNSQEQHQQKHAKEMTATGTPTSYMYDYSSVGGMKYASPVLHHVLLKGELTRHQAVITLSACQYVPPDCIASGQHSAATSLLEAVIHGSWQLDEVCMTPSP